jgi:dTDP-4-dehydrorhamnose reductase
LRPDWIVDTGALHHVDYCEAHPEAAFRTNRDGTAALARAAQRRGIGYLFVSTDYVFDGGTSRPYLETDPARPVNVYGRSKLAGEEAVRSAGGRTIIVRPSVVYSWIPPAERTESASQKSVNFGTWAIDQMAAGKDLRIVDDQMASPTWNEDLARAILALIDREARGTFHATGSTATSRYAFTVALADALGFSSARIRPVSTATLGQAAERPRNSSLDSGRLRATTGFAMPSLHASLVEFSRRYRSPESARALS